MRTGGALVTREVEVYVDTVNGDEEFYGARSVLKFYPGETQKSITLLAKGDGIPEVFVWFSDLPPPYLSVTRIICQVICHRFCLACINFGSFVTREIQCSSWHVLDSGCSCVGCQCFC